jgi:hypothetical protein
MFYGFCDLDCLVLDVRKCVEEDGHNRRIKNEQLPPRGAGMDRGLRKALYRYGGRRCLRPWSVL